MKNTTISNFQPSVLCDDGERTIDLYCDDNGQYWLPAVAASKDELVIHRDGTLEPGWTVSSEDPELIIWIG